MIQHQQQDTKSPGGWRHGSAVKSMGWLLFRESRFGSQDQHGKQLSVTSVPEDPAPSFGLPTPVPEEPAPSFGLPRH